MFFNYYLFNIEDMKNFIQQKIYSQFIKLVDSYNI